MAAHRMPLLAAARLRAPKAALSARCTQLCSVMLPDAARAALSRLSGPLRIFIVAGEPSGDALGGRLMAALRAAAPCDVHFSGVGGPRMREQRLQQVFPAEDLAVMGIAELLPHLPRLAARLRTATAAVHAWQPHALLTVDYKGFNLRLQRTVRAGWRPGAPRPAGVHLVSPSFWAFRGGDARAAALAHTLDELLCILPFELPLLAQHGVAATFVGHPVLEECAWRDGEWHAAQQPAARAAAAAAAADAPLLCVLPGSRAQEVARHMPLFGETLRLLQRRAPRLRALLPTLPPLRAAVAAGAVAWGVPFELADGADSGERYAAFARCDAALAVSGSVTAQLAAARLPAVVAYRAHPITEWVAARRAAVRHVSLPNLVLRRDAVPEAVFGAATADALAAHLRTLLRDAAARAGQQAAAAEFLAAVAPSGGLRPSQVAAAAVLRCVGARLAAPGA